MRGAYTRDWERQHRAKLAAKYERLEGLKALYATREKLGQLPLPGSDMQELRQRIAATRNQIKAMIGSIEEGA